MYRVSIIEVQLWSFIHVLSSFKAHWAKTYGGTELSPDVLVDEVGGLGMTRGAASEVRGGSVCENDMCRAR